MKAKNKTKQPDACCGSQCVRLELACPDAQEVGIAGSFNDWHPNVTPMIQLNDGKWAKELMLPLGRYEYRFVVDGEWVDDLAATELIPNVFGTANAVLVVAARKSPKSPTRVSRAEPEPKPRTVDTSTLAVNFFRRASLAQSAVP